MGSSCRVQSFERVSRCLVYSSVTVAVADTNSGFLSTIARAFIVFFLTQFFLFFLGGSEGCIDHSHVVSTLGPSTPRDSPPA